MHKAVQYAMDLAVATRAASLDACKARLVNECMTRIRFGLPIDEKLSEIAKEVEIAKEREKKKRKMSRNNEVLALRFSFSPREDNKRKSNKGLDTLVFRKVQHA